MHGTWMGLTPGDYRTGTGAPLPGYRGGAHHQTSAPAPIVQALRQKSLNPSGIARKANTFGGAKTAPIASTGRSNPSGADRSGRLTTSVAT